MNIPGDTDNDNHTDSRGSASAAEWRLQRLVVPAPASYDPSRRADWAHDPDHGADGSAGDGNV